MKRTYFLVLTLVAGSSVASNGAHNPLSYSWSTIDVPGASATWPTAINNRGDITGHYTKDGIDHGFILRNGEWHALDAPDPATFATWPAGISPTGVVVGQYRTEGSCPACPPWLQSFAIHGFIWRDGAFEVVEFPGAAYTSVNSMNAKGDAVGEYWDGRAFGFVLSNGNFEQLDMSDPADAPFAWSAAYAINSQGDIAGWSGNGDFASWEFRAYFLRNGWSTTIEVPGFTWVTATAINSRAEVVVQCYQNWSVQKNIIWRSGQQTEVAHPNASWTTIYGINDRGNLVGAYGDAEGRAHGFLAMKR